MKRFYLITALLALLAFPAMADDEVVEPHKVNLGLSFGMLFPDEKEVELPQLLVRDNNVAVADYFGWHLQFDSEFFFQDERFAIGTGLRLMSYSATLERSWDSFYWMVNETATTQDYITMSSLGQYNVYLGVPLSMRVFFGSLQNRVRPFLRANANFDFRISSSNYADIRNKRMENIYESSVLEELGKPVVFHPSVSASVGIRIRCHNFYVNPEVVLPNVELGESPISFIDINQLRCSAGLKLSFQFPVGSAGEKATEVESTYDTQIQSENVMPSEDF